jgi:hypothetical protein
MENANQLGTFSPTSNQMTCFRSISSFVREYYLKFSITALMDTEIKDKISQEELIEKIIDAADKFMKLDETCVKIGEWTGKHELGYSDYVGIDDKELKELLIKYYHRYLYNPLFTEYIQEKK